MSTTTDRTQPSLLVADDHQAIRNLMLHDLRAHFAVDQAVANGRRLVEAALAHPPDAIVSDVNMPVLGGIEAMLALRDCGVDTPFVMVSADVDCARECLARGAAGFVFKGDMRTELVFAVRAVLAGRLYVSSTARVWHAGMA